MQYDRDDVIQCNKHGSYCTLRISFHAKDLHLKVIKEATNSPERQSSHSR